MDMLLTPCGLKQSVDAVMERIGTDIPDAEKNSVKVHVTQIGASVVVHSRFRFREVDGRIGGIGMVNYKGKITGEGFVEFQW